MHFSNNTPAVTSLDALHKAAEDDLYRRFIILEEELQHLINVSDFYAENGEVNESINNCGLIEECSNIAKGVLKDVIGDKENLEDWILHSSQECSGEDGQNNVMLEEKYKKKLIYQAHFRSRARHYAMHVGHINNNLGQRLEGFILEDPAPTVRRATEQEHTGEFLRRLTQNTYRNMNIFIGDTLKCEIPYGDYPRTIHVGSFAETYQAALYRTTEVSNSLKDGDYSLHNVILMSFWNIDFPEHHCILAHEMAHILIDDIAGNLSLLSIGNVRRFGSLGKLGRLLSVVCDSWIRKGIQQEYRLDIEILADILAVSQFDFAYLYSWVIEMLNSDFELRSIKDENNNAYSYKTLKDSDKYLAETVGRFRPTNLDMIAYLRGRAILYVLQLKEFTRDENEAALVSAVKHHIDLVLKLRTEGAQDSDEYILWQTIGDQIEKCIKLSGITSYLISAHVKNRTTSGGAPKDQESISEHVIQKSSISRFEKSTVPGTGKLFRQLQVLDIPWRQVFSDYLKCGKINPQIIEANILQRRSGLDTIKESYLFSTNNNAYEIVVGDCEPVAISSRPVRQKDVENVFSKNEVVKSKYKKKYKNKYKIDIDWGFKSEIFTDEFYLLDLVLGSTPEQIKKLEFPPDKFNDSCLYNTSITFGRYDRYFMLDITKVFHNKIKYSSLYSNEYAYKTRRRMLRKMDFPKIIEDFKGENSHSIGALKKIKTADALLCQQKPSAIILISLKNKTLRHHFIRFELLRLITNFVKCISLRDKLENNDLAIKCQLYSSEGHEDFILEIYAGDIKKYKIRWCLEIAKYIFDSDFTSRTETILSKFDKEIYDFNRFNLESGRECYFLKTLSSYKEWISRYQYLSATIGIRLKPCAALKNFPAALNKKFKSIFEEFVQAYKEACPVRELDYEILNSTSGGFTIQYQTGRIDYIVLVHDELDKINSYITFSILRHCIANYFKDDVARVHTQINETVGV